MALTWRRKAPTGRSEFWDAGGNPALAWLPPWRARCTGARRTGTMRATELNPYIADHPEPYTWTKPADQALARVNRRSVRER
jgi:hypothetical protein